MSTLQLNLPSSLQRHLDALAATEGVPVDQFVVSAVTEKVAALLTEDYLRQRAARANPVAFDAVLSRVPARPPLPDDE